MCLGVFLVLLVQAKFQKASFDFQYAKKSNCCVISSIAETGGLFTDQHKRIVLAIQTWFLVTTTGIVIHQTHCTRQAAPLSWPDLKKCAG